MFVAEPARVLELAIVAHAPRISQRHLVELRCKLSFFFLDLMSLEYPDTNQIWISGRCDGWTFPKNYTNSLSVTGKWMSWPTHPAGRPIIVVSWLRKLVTSPWGFHMTYSRSYSLWNHCVSEVQPYLMTISMLPRSMIVVPITSGRTLEAEC